MTRGAAIFPALILAFTAAMLALGYFHYQYSWTTFSFPLGAGVILCLLCALELASALRHPEADAQRLQEMPALSLRSLAWLFALAPFLWAFGFVFGAALYLLVSLRGNAFSWRASIATAAGWLLVSWGLIIKLLGVQLPIAPLWIG
jgi:hypothetical protein